MLKDHVILIAGSANICTYYQLARNLDKLLSRMVKDDITIISGDNNGTDYAVFLYALRRGIKHVVYSPSKYDFEQGTYRMRLRMLEEATNVITVIQDYDRDIAQLGRICQARNLPRRQINIKGNDYGKPEKSHRRMRSLDGRTLSQYRQRHVDKTIPRWT